MSKIILPKALISLLRPNPVNLPSLIAVSINDKSRPSILTLPITYETTSASTGTNKSISDISIIMLPIAETLPFVIAILKSALTSST